MKKITILIILELFSLNVFAYEGHGFRIISEKFISSPGSQGSIVSLNGTKSEIKIATEDKEKKPSFSRIKDFNFSFDETRATMIPGVKTKADANGARGTLNEFIPVHGYHYIAIGNWTKEYQRYKYIYRLECEQMREYFEREIEMAPGGSFTDKSMSSGVFQTSFEGYYKLYAITQVIRGNEQDSDKYETGIFVGK